VAAGAGQRPIGPDLLNVTRNRNPVWLKRWLAEPDKMLAEKDPLAMGLLAQYNNVAMPNMRLNGKDIQALVDYIGEESARIERQPKRSAEQAAPKDAKCPVCGMFVAKSPDWSASIMYKDGTRRFFDGPKDLFKYYLNPKKFDPALKRSDIAILSVKDYYSVAPIDGRKSYFVTGSDVLGPMGKELIPFAKKGDAEGFLADHKGRKLLRFEEITPVLLKTLD
jgi:nitrous oxide reductase accessory protein NosL